MNDRTSISAIAGPWKSFRVIRCNRFVSLGRLSTLFASGLD